MAVTYKNSGCIKVTAVRKYRPSTSTTTSSEIGWGWGYSNSGSIWEYYTCFTFTVTAPCKSISVNLNYTEVGGMGNSVAINAHISTSSSAWTTTGSQVKSTPANPLTFTMSNLNLSTGTTYYLYIKHASKAAIVNYGCYYNGGDTNRGDLTATFSGVAKASVAKICNGTSFADYTIQIYNGSSWDTYEPYVYNGSSWVKYG